MRRILIILQSCRASSALPVCTLIFCVLLSPNSKSKSRGSRDLAGTGGLTPIGLRPMYKAPTLPSPSQLLPPVFRQAATTASLGLLLCAHSTITDTALQLRRNCVIPFVNVARLSAASRRAAALWPPRLLSSPSTKPLSATRSTHDV